MTKAVVALLVVQGAVAAPSGLAAAGPPASLPPEAAAADPPQGNDPASPPVRLPAVVATLTAALDRSSATDGARRSALQAAIAGTKRALADYVDDGVDLLATVDSLAAAARQTAGARPLNPADGSALRGAQAGMATVARTLAAKVLDRAVQAQVAPSILRDARTALGRGDAKVAAGNVAGGIGDFGQALGLASGGLSFDMDVFEQNILDAVDGNAVGYAYAIGLNGMLARSGAGGQARTAADAPAVAQSSTKEQFLASVSKNVTAVATMRALQDAGVAVGSPIAPYVPPTWSLHATGATLTFEQLMTHRSDFSANVGSSYDLLRQRIEAPFAFPAGFDYENANFGLLRVLVPRVVAPGFVPDLLPGDAAGAYALAFENYVRTTVLQPMGIDGRCRPTDASPTRYYKLPDAGAAGYQEPDRLLTCGGYGWFLSAHELAAFLAHTRYNNAILSPASRGTMDSLFLGWMDPADGYSSPVGVFGTYHAHGGDWYHAPGEAHTCAMKFPIQVEVSLVVNSERGFATYQCDLLRDAFDQAWVS